jgi:quercetin dioxygenase-like cupin family protein
MPRILIAALFVLVLSVVALAQDPVKVDGNHYKVEFENDQVRVLRVKVGPAEKSIMHSHPNAVAIFMTDITGKFTFPDGKTEDANRKAGDVLWTPAVTHMPENVGSQGFEVILVELKGKAPAPSTKKANHAAPRRR